MEIGEPPPGNAVVEEADQLMTDKPDDGLDSRLNQQRFKWAIDLLLVLMD